MKLKTWVTISMLVTGLSLAPAMFGQDEDEQLGGGGKGRQGRWENQMGMGNLSPAERDKLKAAQQKARQDPAVQTAHEKMQQARKDFREAMQAAMLRADPSIQPILDKIPANRRGL